ncbi:MAG: DUF3800 domain-containing protein [Candidatus Brocadiia bacterium]
MFLCYVDESGHCGRSYNESQPVEVLAGVLINTYKLKKTLREQTELLELLRNNGIPIEEFKASDIYRGRRAWEQVDPEVRVAVFDYLLRWMNDRACKLAICPVDTDLFFALKKNEGKTATLMEFPFEAGALNVVLAVQREHRNKKRNKGNTIFIFDEQHDHSSHLLELFDRDLRYTDAYVLYEPKPRAKKQPERLDQVIDVPHFTKSHLALPVQLADAVAFIVRRYLELTLYESPERYAGEQDQLHKWYKNVGECMITHTSIDPPVKKRDPLCQFYDDVRPEGWSAHRMKDYSCAP